MSQRILRFGVIGCGLMGREFASAAARWAHLLEMDVKPKIVAVCDTNPKLMEWFLNSFSGVTQCTTDFKALLENPDVDAVYCAVPHNLHQDLYLAIIRAGKHLMGEKPFGMNLEQNTAILAELQNHPELIVRCSSEFPFFPAAQKIFNMALEKKFGRIIELEAGFHHSSDLDPNKPINWKRMIAVNGEYGVMGDLGFHTVHIPFRLGWKPQNVRALLSNIVTERPDGTGKLVPCETWDNAQLLTSVAHDGYEFPMNLSMKRIAPGEQNTWFIKIAGTELSAEFSTKYPKTLRTMPYVSGAPQAWQSLDVGYDTAYPTITGNIFEFGLGDAILQMWAAFCDEVAGNTPRFQCATALEAASSHKLFSAALESQASSSVVALNWE